MNKLLIVSHVIHYKYGGKLYAYGPYVKEIDIWAKLFPEVVIASPLHYEFPQSDCIMFENDNISIIPQMERGGENLKSKLWQIISLPKMIWQLSNSMHKVDAIQVRCPGNLGLLGILLAPFFSKYRIAKFAGQWTGYPSEPFTVKLQRWLLKSKWWNAPVTVYGNWPNQPKHVIPFFTSMLTDEIIELAKTSSTVKKKHDPIRILFVGRLSKSKNVDTLIKAINILSNEGINIECKIIGVGDQLETLVKLTESLKLSSMIHFLGGLKFEKVIDYYIWADILVLVSETEGWPKAITEAMAFGVVCIGSNRGLIPHILGEGRGIVIEPGDHSKLAIEISKLCTVHEIFKSLSRSAAEWSQKYSISSLKNELKEVMKREWKIDFS
jgi:glycosyltransferase involved in cell wall biosynthesis